MNTGHGHVVHREDGVKVRCGGPGVCSKCSQAAVSAWGSAKEEPRMSEMVVHAFDPEVWTVEAAAEQAQKIRPGFFVGEAGRMDEIYMAIAPRPYMVRGKDVRGWHAFAMYPHRS